MKKIIVIVIISLVMVGCTAFNGFEPIGKEKSSVSSGFGGPLIGFAGMTIPVPYLYGGYKYGLSDNINVFGYLHITPLFYKISGLDCGFSYFPMINDGLIPTIGITPQLLAFSSLKSDVDERFRAYPQLSVSFAWKLYNGTIYTGLTNTFQFSKPLYDNEAKQWIMSPFVGYKWKLGNSLKMLTEIKLNGINVQSNQVSVEYVKIGTHGALSTLVTLEWSL
jgi:hypothetical protein